MSYFIKDGGTAFSDLEGSFEGVTFKPIQTAFSAYMSPIDKTQTIGGNHAPWFCIKDASKRMSVVYWDGAANKYYTGYKGYDLPVMTCTISSLSSRYFLTGYNPSDSNSYYGSFQLPAQVFTYFKKDILVKDQNGNVKMNVGCDHIVNNNGNKLRWTIPTTAFDLYKNFKLSQTQIHDEITAAGKADNIFFANFRGDNFANVYDTLSSNAGEHVYTASLLNRMDFVNCKPETDNTLWGYTENLYNRSDLVPYVSKPPCFALQVKQIKDAGYTGLKITINALATFAENTNTAESDNNRNLTAFIQNPNNFYNGDPYCCQFLYQFSNGTTWSNDGTYPVSGSFSAGDSSYGTYNHNLTTAAGFSYYYYNTAMYINGGGNGEYQYDYTPEFWSHVIPYNYNNYDGNNADDKIYSTVVDGTKYYVYASAHTDKDGHEVQHTRENINYGNYGIVPNVPLDLTKSWTSISSNFKIWNTPNNWSKSLLVNGDFYGNSKQTSVKTTLSMGDDNDGHYKSDWMKIVSGSNHYTFTNYKTMLTIDLNNRTENYLLISMPGTTVFLNEKGPAGNNCPSGSHLGLIHQLEMTYEGTK